MTSQVGIDEQNRRVLQAVAYLIEWAKHVVTIAAALMVLGATFLKDLAKGITPPVSYGMAVALVLFYVSMLMSVLLALKLVRQSANTVLTTQPQIGLGTELATLKNHLGRTQLAFMIGLVSFSVFALSILLTWALAPTGQSSHSTGTPATLSSSLIPSPPAPP